MIFLILCLLFLIINITFFNVPSERASLEGSFKVTIPLSQPFCVPSHLTLDSCFR